MFIKKKKQCILFKQGYKQLKAEKNNKRLTLYKSLFSSYAFTNLANISA